MCPKLGLEFNTTFVQTKYKNSLLSTHCLESLASNIATSKQACLLHEMKPSSSVKEHFFLGWGVALR